MKAIDLTGRRFGRLQVLSLSPEGPQYGRRKWLCRCDCGNAKVVGSELLLRGTTKSCGCLRRPRVPVEGGCYTAEYRTWRCMLRRCQNPAHRGYEDYGGRGIQVCDRWQSLEAFIADMGKRPGVGFSIDRIDVDGDYTPGNCRWATATDQMRNRRRLRTNTSGTTGVHWHTKNKSWFVRITVDNKPVHVGVFDTFEAAAAARKQAELTLWRQA